MQIQIQQVWGGTQNSSLLTNAPMKPIMFGARGTLRTRVRFSHYAVSDSFLTPWSVAHQTPLSLGFPRQEYIAEPTGVGCHFLIQGIFPTQGLKPCIGGRLLPLSHQGSPGFQNTEYCGIAKLKTNKPQPQQQQQQKQTAHRVRGASLYVLFLL